MAYTWAAAVATAARLAVDRGPLLVNKTIPGPGKVVGMFRDLLQRRLPRTLLVAATALLCVSCAETAKKPSGGTASQTSTTAKNAPSAETAKASDATKRQQIAKAPETAKADAMPPVAKQVAGEDTAAAKQTTDVKTGGETAADEKTADEKAANEKTAADGDKAPKVDPYAVPDGTPEELLKFIQDLSAYRPDVKSNEEAIEHLGKQHKAIIAAADKILAAKPDEAGRASALKSKIQSSWIAANMVDHDSLPKVVELLQGLAKDKNPEVANSANVYLMVAALRSITADKAVEAKALVAQVAEALGKDSMDELMPQIAMVLPSALENAGHMELARDAARQFIAALKKKKSQELAPVIEQLEGMLQKLEIIGKPLDIEGTLVDGKKFDWSAYKGKVVLVDFWATWCGPCLGELPNVRKTYDTYHDRGFDVVGISLDDDKATLDAFLAKEGTPWPILFGTTPEASGRKHPMAVKYHIDGIPAPFLVNKEGNVVSTNARGEVLPRLVAELLGPAPAATDKSAGDKSADAKKAGDKPASEKETTAKEPAKP
jgi:thiol-disulfide isomerase/thioredoxin